MFNLKTVAIKNFLTEKTVPDLAALYSYNMEVQVNVLQGDGLPTTNEYKGTVWRGYENENYKWKTFRIPYNARSEPTYEDHPITFPLEKYAEGIGMTGWNWVNRQSIWVAFDFDSLIGHKQSGLASEELDKIQQASTNVDWVTVRRSTSGNGLHFYVFFDEPIKTENHTEHAALGRYILGTLSAVAGFNFSNKVDICGGNMWVWHRKMVGTEGLTLIKQGKKFADTKENWREHIEVCSGQRKRSLPKAILDQNDTDDSDQLFSELTGQYVKEQIDSNHKKLLKYLENNNCFWYWNQDGNMLITHTFHLKEAHAALNLKGYFDTLAEGTQWGNDHNCFCYPIRRGGWVVRRFSVGCTEHDSWDRDGSGWTRCYYNVNPDLKTVSNAFEGVEDSDGGFVFTQAERAMEAVNRLGANMELTNFALNRKTKVKQHSKDASKLIIEIARESSDNPAKMPKWIENNKTWKRVYRITQQGSAISAAESKNFDDIIRHIVTEKHQDAGWVIQTDGQWTEEPMSHAKMALKSMGHSAKAVEEIMGESVFRKWTLVNKPFQPEYPGDRQWNKDACQLRYSPSKSDNPVFPTWSLILNHVGAGLDTVIQEDRWCQQNGILSGGDYLKCWIASLFQYPERPLPYLFLYGPEKGGKSIFHEILSELITTRGYQRADTALLSQAGFNNELRYAVICVIEEVNLSTKNRLAHNRIKDWVTSPMIQIHPKGGDPYMIANTMHFIQCSNNKNYCMVFKGDTRVTMIYVTPPEVLIDKYDLISKCKKEAPDFLAELYNLDLPTSSDKRLNVPVIETSEKQQLQEENQSALEAFISERCFRVNGASITLAEFYDEFMRWLDPTELSNWSKLTVSRAVSENFPKGRCRTTNNVCVGNVAWEKIKSDSPPFILVDGKLTLKAF